ncbi:hypothetical protein OAW78_00660 [Schleiferiaceae bacterium]|nr:hypothetical protein [Schleiferiaceae bacterium]
MNKQFNPQKFSLINSSYSDFQKAISDGHLRAREARLIPVLKAGDEMALASVFLSSLKYVKEYREKFFKAIKFKKTTKLYYFTEVAFASKEYSSSRLDGLILSVANDKIKDAVILEFKGKNGIIDPIQIEQYITLNKSTFKADKLVSISPEYVPDVDHLPYVPIGRSKTVSLYHFSWSHLKNIASLLLFQNGDNIEDEDQVNILNEVLYYLESDVNGLKGFSQMKSGWKNVVEAIKTGVPPKKEDLDEAVQSWLEEQTDMSHLLSSELGVPVTTSSVKKDGDLGKKLKSETAQLLKTNQLKFKLMIKDVVSDIDVVADFRNETVEMSIQLDSPSEDNKKNRARLTWLNNQLKKAQEKETEVFNSLSELLFIDVSVKFGRQPIRYKLTDFHLAWEELVNEKDITSYNIVAVNDLGAKFKSNRKFVELIEQMMFDFYQGLVQNLKSYTRPAPRISQND